MARRRRIAALLALGMTLAAATSTATVSAADSTHVRLSRTGTVVSFGAVHDGLWVTTEVGASSEASRDGGPSTLLWISQAAWAPDETGEYNVFVWSLDGTTSDFAMTIADQLSSAEVSAAMPINRCDETNGCVEGSAAVDVTVTAVGTIQRSHQRSIGSVSHQSLFIYNNVGKYRFATATVAVDGIAYGPSTGPSDANIYDTQTGWIDMTKASAGTRAVASGVTVYDTTETPTGRRTGESMYAGWVSEADGIGHNTGLAAASEQISTKGTVLKRSSISYYDQVYAIDEFGNTASISETFSTGEGSSATTIAVDRTLNGGRLTGATIPATSCTYIDEEILCVDTEVHADGSWTGVGTTTKTQDGSTASVAGVLVIVYRNASTHRAATATATIDGVSFSGSSDGAMDRSTTGFHEVHIGD